jgi:hypothetical protein
MKKPTPKKSTTATTRKPATKKAAKATKAAAPKASLKPGTVGWLIEELKNFPKDMYVVHGDHDNVYYDPKCVEVLSILEGEVVDEKKGEKTVCIGSTPRPWRARALRV